MSEEITPVQTEETTSESQAQLDEQKVANYISQLKLEQNLPAGIIGGAMASLIGAIVWAVITVATEFQIGYMAVAVGFLVGYAVRFSGKGLDQTFGIVGAVLALVGCLLGNFLSIIGFVANAEELGYFETIGLIDFAVIPEIMAESFSPIDLVFYGVAVYEGYRFSFREITEEEIGQNAFG